MMAITSIPVFIEDSETVKNTDYKDVNKPSADDSTDDSILDAGNAAMLGYLIFGDEV